ncbi:MAG: cation:proton antiporter [Gemmatimonadota bacterium]|nr:cation:proton antiporter [Gemmatimonadota bacterium]
MFHETALIATLAAGFGLAFLFGFAAVRLGMPALLGYIVAGVVVGPFTPGYIADTGLAPQLAEVGVILLMLGVGMHFSVRDLKAVWRVAVPGALIRMAAITLVGAAVGRAWDWTWGASLVFGLSLAIASTVVVLRVLEGRGLATSVQGRVAVGWLVVEDLATVFVLVLLPALVSASAAGGGSGPGVAAVFDALGLTLFKVAAFIALMLFVGTRVVPWLLSAVARTGSRELLTLSVLALALTIALGAAQLFGVSFALGAFFAGVVIAESDVSHQAAADALPLQDAFSVLFFVAVGMVFNPRVLIEHPVGVLATLLLVTLGKGLVSAAILSALRLPLSASLETAAALSQIGEFSFILAGLAVSLGVLPPTAQNLIVAASILSITLNPLVLQLAAPVERWVRARPALAARLDREESRATARTIAAESAESAAMHDHAVIVGFGRVGALIGRALERQGIPFLIVEKDREWFERLRERGLHVLFGDASKRAVLEHAHLERARLLVIAAPGTYQTRAILDAARQLNPAIDVVVRTHSASEQVYLEAHGVGEAVMGERELALGMARYALHAFGTDAGDAEGVLELLRMQRTAHTQEWAGPVE